MSTQKLVQRFGRNIGLAALLCTLSATSGRAQITSNWTNTSGGNFADSGNWDNGVPGAIDTAAFGLPNSYTVNIAGSQQTTGLLLDTVPGPSNVNFYFPTAGDSYTVTGGFVAPIGQSSGSNDNLTISGAGSFNPYAVQIAGSPGAQGSLTVNGSMNVTLMAVGAGFGFGYAEMPGGYGTLTLNAGSNVSIGALHGDFSGDHRSAINFNGGTLTVGSISVNAASVALSPIGDGTDTAVLNLGAGTISSTPLVVSQNATVNFDAPGYTLNVDDIQRDTGGANPGTFNFIAGILNLNNAGFVVSPTGQVGDSLDLTGQRSVSVRNGDPTVGTTVGTSDPNSGTLSISGGELSTNTLTTNAGGTTTFNSGTLVVGIGDLAIGPGGLNGGPNIGGVTTTTANQHDTMIVAGATTVASGYGLTINGGYLQTGAFTNNGGNATFSSGAVAMYGGDLHVGSSGFNTAPSGGAPTVTLNAGDAWTLYGTATTYVDSNSSLTINGGALNTPHLTTDGGTTTFTSGALYINNGDLHIGPSGLNGVTNFSLDGSGSITVAGATIVDSGYSFTLNGGILQTGTFTNNGGAAAFNSGRLNISSGNLTVGNSQDLNGSATTTINSGSSITLNGATTINSSGALIINGGSLGTGTFVNNGGLATFSSGSLGVSGDLAIGNAGLNGGNRSGATTTIGGFSSIYANGTTSIAAGFGLTIDGEGARFNTGAISRDTTLGNPGTFTFISGQLGVAFAELDIGAGANGVDNGNSPVTLDIGSAISTEGNTTIDAGKSLVISGGAFQTVGLTVNGAGTLSGGQFSTGSVYVATFNTTPGVGTFTYTGGSLTIYGGSLNIGASGITNGSNGTIVSIPSGSVINISNFNNSSVGALSIDSGHELDLTGGSLYVNSIVNNSGGLLGYSGGYLEVDNDNLSIGPNGQLNNTPSLTVAGGDNIFLRNGGITIQAGQSFVVDGGRVTAASLTNSGGTFDYQHGNLYLTANSSDLTIGSGLIRRGQGQAQQTLALAGGDVITVNGSLTIDNSATIDGPTNAAIQIGGNILIEHGSTVTGNLSISQGHGAGTFVNHGILSPGSPTDIGNINISAGDFTEASDGELDFKLAGTTPGQPGHPGQYDQLFIGAPVHLGGTLRVSLLDGFIPQLGDTFALLDPPSIDGSFDTLELPALPSGEQWGEQILGPNNFQQFQFELQVEPQAVPEPGSLALAGMGAAFAAAIVVRRRRRIR